MPNVGAVGFSTKRPLDISKAKKNMMQHITDIQLARDDLKGCFCQKYLATIAGANPEL
jgi:hypothetical protein